MDAQATHIGESTFPIGFGSGDTHATTLGDGSKNTREAAGTPYETIGWSDIVCWAMDPPSVPKINGPWMLCGSYAGPEARNHATQREQGMFGVLAADIDAGDPPVGRVIAAAQACVGRGVEALVYASRGAKPTERKWRVLIPLAQPLDGDTWAKAQWNFFDRLMDKGLIIDPVLARPGQLCFLPNKGDYYHYEWISGDFLTLDEGHSLLKEREVEVEDTKKWITSRSAIVMIDIFNRRNPIEDLLARYGYVQEVRNGTTTDNWRSPMQTSESFATRNFHTHWVSMSWADRDAKIGAKHKIDYVWGDSFDLFVFFEHKNEMGAAMKELRARQRLTNPAQALDVDALRAFLARREV